MFFCSLGSPSFAAVCGSRGVEREGRGRRGGACPASMGSQAGKWLGFVTAMWVQAISGNNYTFSNYSDALKTLMGLTQLQLNNLSIAKDVGKAFGILAGLAIDRYPIHVILLIGSLEGLLGFGAQWLVVSQAIRPLPYWQMCVFLIMGGNSTQWMHTAIMVTCIRNFRDNRGPVASILKGYVGLSSAIFTDLCVALFANSASSFLLMLALVPFAVCLTAMLFLREEPRAADTTEEDDRWEGRYFAFLNGGAAVVAAYLAAFDLSGSHSATVSRAFAAGLIFLLATPLAAPFHVWLRSFWARRRQGSRDAEAAMTTPLLAEAAFCSPVEGREQKDGGGGVANVDEGAAVPAGGGGEGDAAEAAAAAAGKKVGKRRPAIGEDHTVVDVARSADFWLVSVTFLCGVGTGVMVMNNMGQMGLALGYTDVSIFVSLLSIFSFFGRLGGGFISEYFLRKAATPRPLLSAASQIPMAVGYIVMAMALPGSLYIGSIGVGLSYGVRQSITVTTTSELFGLKSYGVINNIVTLNLPLGSFLFSGLLAGILYDAQATRTASGANTCVGHHCYQLVFLIMAFVCTLGLGLDVLLAIRTKALYAKIHAAIKSRKTAAKRPPAIKG